MEAASFCAARAGTSKDVPPCGRCCRIHTACFAMLLAVDRCGSVCSWAMAGLNASADGAAEWVNAVGPNSSPDRREMKPTSTVSMRKARVLFPITRVSKTNTASAKMSVLRTTPALTRRGREETRLNRRRRYSLLKASRTVAPLHSAAVLPEESVIVRFRRSCGRPVGLSFVCAGATVSWTRRSCGAGAQGVGEVTVRSFSSTAEAG
ncbi:hypothetical protein DFJ73DRAFT_843230 [Zopfochytrium polystomum]|nr:hypothetical protein DFJ73DRAFT_843230 [Zopfochytrium polystomum]